MAVKPWQYLAVGVALIGGAGYFYLHHGDTFGLDGVSGSGIFGRGPASSSSGSSSGWQTVKRPDAGFRIEVPSEPEELQVPAYNEAGSTEPVKMIFSNPEGDTTFAVSWEDNPPVARVNNGSLDKTLDMARDGMLARTRTTLQQEDHITAAGFTARDLTAQNAGGGVLQARLIFTGNRLYTLMALFPSSAARREQDVTRFFNSFAMSKSPGPSLPEAEYPSR